MSHQNHNPMKKLLFITLTSILIFSAFTPLSAQESSSLEKPNELYGGYGAFSVYYFTGNLNHDYYYDNSYSYYYDENDPTSAGTFFLGYNRQVTKVVSVGIVFSYMHTTNTLNGYYGYYDSLTNMGTTNDHLLSGLTKVNFT